MTTAACNASAATVLARALVGGGLSDVVVSPGSRSTPLLLAFDATPGARLHLVLDERVAGFIALGLARATGRPVGLLCTSGSAGAHYLPAIVEASESRVPLLVMTADRPPELHQVGAPQTTDQQRFFGPHVRAFTDVGAPGAGVPARWLRTVAARALATAEGSPAGPVHVNIPFREPLWEAGPLPEAPFEPPIRVVRGAARVDASDVSALAERLSRCRRGVLVAGPRAAERGPGAVHGFADAVTALAAALEWPVLADVASGLRFGRHDLRRVVAAGDAILRSGAFAEAQAPDVVVRFGQVPTSRVLQEWLARHAAGRTVLVAGDGAFRDPDHLAEALWVSEPAALCRDLRAAIAPSRRDREWIATWRAADDAAQGVLGAAGDVEGALARAVVDVLPDGALLHAASSMPIRDLDTFAPCRARGLAVSSSRGVNGIDGTLATGFGAALGWRVGPVVVLAGDLAFLHDHAALHAARELGVRATVVVVNNGGGAIFGHLPIAASPAFERWFLTPQGADLGAIARAAGAQAVTVDTTGGLRTALLDDLERPGVGVVEVLVDRETSTVRRAEVLASAAAAAEESMRRTR